MKIRVEDVLTLQALANVKNRVKYITQYEQSKCSCAGRVMSVFVLRMSMKHVLPWKAIEYLHSSLKYMNCHFARYLLILIQ